MHGQFNGWSGTKNQNIPGMICWGFAIYWGMAANRIRSGEGLYWREAKTPVLKAMDWE